jgi:hypothetical protein
VPISEDEYQEFLANYRHLLRDLREHGDPSDGAFRNLLREHLGVDATGLPIVSDEYAPLEHPNLQLAVEDFVSESGRASRLVGVLGGQRRLMGMGLRDLIGARGDLTEGPVEYETRPIGVDASLPCVVLGL